MIERFVANLLEDEQTASTAAAQQLLPVRSRQIIASPSTMEELMRARAEALAQEQRSVPLTRQRSVPLSRQLAPQQQPPQLEPPREARHQRGQRDWDVLPFA